MCESLKRSWSAYFRTIAAKATSKKTGRQEDSKTLIQLIRLTIDQHAVLTCELDVTVVPGQKFLEEYPARIMESQGLQPKCCTNYWEAAPGVAGERSARLSVVLTAQEVKQVMVRMSGVAGVVVKLPHGGGLRLLEGPLDCSWFGSLDRLEQVAIAAPDLFFGCQAVAGNIPNFGHFSFVHSANVVHVARRKFLDLQSVSTLIWVQRSARQAEK